MELLPTEGARLLLEGLARYPSQAALSQLLGCSQQSVSGYAAGRVRPEPPMRAVMALVMGIPEHAWLTQPELALVEAARERLAASRRADKSRRVVQRDSGRHLAARPSRTGTEG